MKESKVDFIVCPGSFKPPHKGHLSLIEHYLTLSKRVIVVVSNPKKATRKTITGTNLSPETSIEIFNIFLKSNNVEFISADVPNVYDSIFAQILDKLPKDQHFNWSVGYYPKDNKHDFRNIFGTNVVKEVYPHLTFVDPTKIQFQYTGSEFEGISASRIRENITDLNVIRTFMPKHLSEDEIFQVFNSLNR